jgi:adenosylcobinamide amidohydrolase
MRRVPLLGALRLAAACSSADDQSDYPAGVPATKLSGFKPNAEAVIAYKPDLVVLSNDTGGIVSSLRRAAAAAAVGRPGRGVRPGRRGTDRRDGPRALRCPGTGRTGSRGPSDPATGANVNLELVWRSEDGLRLPMAVWRPGPGHRMISSGMAGGGIGPGEWVLNAQVPGGYSRMDPADHLRELALAQGLTGPGVGLLTAASVERVVQRSDEGVVAAATVGLRVPTWAAAPPSVPDSELAPMYLPGTINIVVSVPVRLTGAALVNAVITATEAKTQALLEAGYSCTGTASDAICVAAPSQGAAEPFTGPRSEWGARIARAVHAAVLAGSVGYSAYRSSR